MRYRVRITVLALVLLHAVAPYASESTEASFEESLRAWQSGDGVRARELALQNQRAHPSSAALALHFAELLYATEGPAGLARLSASPIDERARLAVEIMEHRTWRRFAQADSTLLELEAGGGDLLDRLYIGCQRIEATRQADASLSMTQAESLAAWVGTQSELRFSPYLGGFLALSAESGYATAYASLVNRREGVRMLDAILERATEAGQRYIESQTAFRLGFLTAYGFDRAASLRYWSRAISTAAAIGDRMSWANALTFRASEYSSSGGAALALADEEAAYPAHVELDDKVGLAWNRLSIGWDSWLVGSVGLAERAMLEALDLFVIGRIQRGEGLALNNLGVIYTATDRSDEAIRVYRQALELAIASGNTSLQSYLYNNMAGLRFRTTDLEESQRLYQVSLDLAREIGDTRGVVSRLGNLGLVSIRLGHVEQARLFFEEAISLARQNGDLGGEAYAAHNYASGLIGLDRAEEAAPLLARAAEIAMSQSDLNLIGAIQLEVARMHRRLHNNAACLAAADSSIGLATRLGSPRVLPSWILKAASLEALGRHEEAIAAADWLEQKAVERDSPDLRATARNLRTTSLLGSQRLEEARAESRRAMQDFSVALDRFGSRRWTENELATMEFYIPGSNALENFTRAFALPELSTDAPELAEAFDFLQKLKARSILDRLRGASESVRPQVGEQLLDDERASKLALDRVRAELESTPSDSLRLAAAEAEAEFHRLRASVLSADTRFARANERSVASWSEIQSELGPDEAILDYYVGHAQNPILLFFGDRSGLAVVSLPAERTLRPQIDLFLRLLTTPAAPGQDSRAIALVGEDLAAQLFGSAVERVARYERLIVIPDGILHTIPFAALSRDAHYLVESHAITVSPSVSVWVDRRNAARLTAIPDGEDFAIWVSESGQEGEAETRSPLPYAKAEADGIQTHFKSARLLTPRVGGSALERLASAQLLGRSKILHFITHGYFDERRPWASGIYLDGPDNEGDWLDATDVYHLDFSSELVTLSACETAGGQGLQGFAQALFGSGARSVLATLWRIDDLSTPFLMRSFYQNLAVGQNKSLALANAQRRSLEDPVFSHPFYWGAFVLLGDGSAEIPLRSRRAGGARYWLGGALIFMFAAALSRRSSRRPA